MIHTHQDSLILNTFVTHRVDRNAHGGGLLCYVKQNIPHKNRSDLAINSDGIESVVIQVKTNIRNSFFTHIYKPPNFPSSL